MSETGAGIKMSHDPLFFSLLWTIPFSGILMSLALIPLISLKFWHNQYKKILMGWIIIFLICCAVIEGPASTLRMFLGAMFHHYIPFMALITVLFTVGGGIHIKMQGKASPSMNTTLLSIGALLANIIGTTGASMLLIRPFIALNKYRLYTTHLVIFFIFIVSNIGGVLTPLGDPPLFIGFLNNVDFFWTTKNLIFPFLFVGGSVLAIFWMVDHYYFYHDPSVPDPTHMNGEAKIQIKGYHNLIFLSLAIATILVESTLTEKPHFFLFDLATDLSAIGRDLLLLSVAYISWKLTPAKTHKDNHSTWEPLEEVARVFLGIFITVIPILNMLKSGDFGPLKDLIHLANPNNIPNSALYFWLTGLLSSILDNAPTYLIFFNIAGGEAKSLMNEGANVLAAISTGAVFMGAMTYIGNAPNFMVHSIAVRSHIKMPGFLGYILWSISVLLPIFACFSWLWFY